MADEKVDWDAMLERRLVESRERQRDEAQAAGPAPGPQAAEQVIEKLRTAAENGSFAYVVKTKPLPSLVNTLFANLIFIENKLLTLGVNLPFGLSIYCIARKKTT